MSFIRSCNFIKVLLIVLCSFTYSLAHSQEQKNLSIYNAITSGDKWLNVNRNLEPSDLENRIILLDFWTYCCINCMHIIPDLKYLEEKFKDKLTVIGVHSAKFNNEKDIENVRSAILRYGIEHPVVNDPNFIIWKKFGIRAWPTLVLIGADGEIKETYSGEGHRDSLERDIEGLINSTAKINKNSLPLALEKENKPMTVLKFPGKIEYAKDISGAPALFISDSGNNRILAVRMDGRVFMEIGSGKSGLKDGNFEEAKFNNPQGLAFRNGNLFIADTGNHVIRKVNIGRKEVITVIGTGRQGNARTVFKENAKLISLSSPWDITFYPDDDSIAIAMAGTHQLWSYDLKSETVSVLAGSGVESIKDGTYPFNSLSQPSGLSLYEGDLYFVDSETSSLRVLSGEHVKTLIGEGLFDFGFIDGKKGKALMQHPLGIFADESGIYIADTYNHSIRRYDQVFKHLKNFSGDGVRGEIQDTLSTSRYNEPADLLKVGNNIYIADTNNHAIRVIDIKNNEVYSLPIIPMDIEEDKKEEYQEELPNMLRLPQSIIKSQSVFKVIMNIKSGWKINPDAPSWINLYEIDGTEFINTLHFEKKNIEPGVIAIPPLPEGKDYKIQGTIYYCEKKPDASCLIQSFDKMLKTSYKSSNTDININLTYPEKK